MVLWTSKLREDAREEVAAEECHLWGTDYAIWGWPWGRLGLVLHLLKCASTNQKKPIY